MADLLDRILDLDERIEKLKNQPTKSFIARGTWSPNVYYMPGDLVAYDGKSYLCVTRTKALPSDETDYVLFADRGIQGEQGIEGEKGLKGDDADPAEVADEIKKDIEFIAKIKGAKGDTGPQGPKGDKGDPGKDGAKGPKGDKGDKGDDGLSAYEVWKKKGNKGSEQDFLNSLKGETYIAGAGSRVPNGGTTGQVLKKASNANQDLVWGSGGGGGGTVDTIVAGNNIDVDATDPANPIVSVETLTVADISDVTASAAELNILDGVTADANEINKLDGLLPTTTELNYVDGVTSAIQTQLDGKVSDTGDTITGDVIITESSSSATNYNLSLENSSATATSPSGINFRNSAGLVNTARITGNPGSTYTNSSLKIEVADSSKTLQTRMNIDVAGVVTVPTAQGSSTNAIVATDHTQTLANKRITKRVTSITSSATPTINTDNCDKVDITALATAITSMTTNLSGTPSNGDMLVFEIKDDGTARAIAWGASFVAGGVALPTTTVISKILTVGFMYSTANSLNKWRCIASVQEA